MSEQPNHVGDPQRDRLDSPRSDDIADLAPDVIRADAADQVKGGADPINESRRRDPLRAEPINE